MLLSSLWGAQIRNGITSDGTWIIVKIAMKSAWDSAWRIVDFLDEVELPWTWRASWWKGSTEPKARESVHGGAWVWTGGWVRWTTVYYPHSLPYEMSDTRNQSISKSLCFCCWLFVLHLHGSSPQKPSMTSFTHWSQGNKAQCPNRVSYDELSHSSLFLSFFFSP